MGLLDSLRTVLRPDPKLEARVAEDSGPLLAAVAGRLHFVDQGPGTLPEWTPLLAAGEGGNQRFTRILCGRLGGTASTAGPCTLASFVYAFRRSRDFGWGRSNVGEISCVLVAVELAMPEDAFQGVFVLPREPSYGYSGTRLPFEIQELKTGDPGLDSRYDMYLDDRQDEEVALRLLSDRLGDWLATFPIELGFEIVHTRLCAFVERPLTTEAEVRSLLDASRWLAPRVIAAAG
jgi:hypothetical protein